MKGITSRNILGCSAPRRCLVIAAVLILASVNCSLATLTLRSTKQGNAEDWHDGDWTEGSTSSDYPGPGSITYSNWGALGLDAYNSLGQAYWSGSSLSPSATEVQIKFRCMSNELGSGQYVDIYLRRWFWGWVKIGTITDKANQEWTLTIPSGDVSKYVSSDGRCDFIATSNDGYVFDYIKFYDDRPSTTTTTRSTTSTTRSTTSSTTTTSIPANLPVIDSIDDIYDRNYLPYRDGTLDSGSYTYNSSRCFYPGDSVAPLIRVRNPGSTSRSVRFHVYFDTDMNLGNGYAYDWTSDWLTSPGNDTKGWYVSSSMSVNGGPYYTHVTLEVSGCGVQDTAWANSDMAFRVENSVPVILIHGINRNNGTIGDCFANLEAIIESDSAGYRRPVRGFEYKSDSTLISKAIGPLVNPSSSAAYQDSLARQLDQFIENLGYSSVDVIAYSYGGLVSRGYCYLKGSSHRIRRLMTLASPHYGSIWYVGMGSQGDDLLRGGRIQWQSYSAWQEGNHPSTFTLVATDNLAWGDYNDF